MILFAVMLCMLALVVQGGEVQLTNSYARKSYDVLDRSDRDLPLELMIVVNQKNTQHLEEELLKVSMPSSPMYGQHWTEEQVVEFTSNPTGVAAVKEFNGRRNHEMIVKFVSVKRHIAGAHHFV